MAEIKINIGGKERIASIGLAMTERAVKFEQPKDFNVLQIAPIRRLYHALVTECELNGETPDFTLKDVYGWVEDLGSESNLLNEFEIAHLRFMGTYLKNDELLEAVDEIEGKLKPQAKPPKPTKSGSNGGTKK